MFFVKFFKHVHVDGKPRLVLFGRFQPEFVKQYHRELFRRIYIESFTGVRVNLCGERFDFVLVFFPKFFQNPDVDFHARTFHIEQNPFKRQFDIVIQGRKILAFKFLFEVVADCKNAVTESPETFAAAARVTISLKLLSPKTRYARSPTSFGVTDVSTPASLKRCKSFFRSERSEERRVGKECRSRWSPYH